MSHPGPSSRLFEPLQIGQCRLSSRIVMGPLSRNKADKQHVQDSDAAEYYAQRACVPGTLIITEGTFVSLQAGGYADVPGIWSSQQIAAWKEVVDAVHKAGSYIFLQLWALGRVADVDCRQQEGTGKPMSSSAIAEKEDGVVPREMTEDDIRTSIDDHAAAAKNAVEAAGFDGVEIHGGNGYFIDQFTQDVSNQRTDAWGGSVQNRSRFALEIAKAVVNAVGSDRVGFRLSPWSTFQGMGMRDAKVQFFDLMDGLKDLKLAYIHLIESRVAGKSDVESSYTLDVFIDRWAGASPILLAGGYTPENARQALDYDLHGKDIAIAFGRLFITHPDLVARLKQGQTLD